MSQRIKVKDFKVGDHVPGLGTVATIKKMAVGIQEVYAWVTTDGALFLERADDSYYVERKLGNLKNTHGSSPKELRVERTVGKADSVFLEIRADDFTRPALIHVSEKELREKLDSLPKHLG